MVSADKSVCIVGAALPAYALNRYLVTPPKKDISKKIISQIVSGSFLIYLP